MTVSPVSAAADAVPLAIDDDHVALYKKAGALAVAQAIGLVAPLITIPYLARVLGPSAWGPIVAAQAFGNWMLLVLEFGFELSGTRAVARSRVSPSTTDDVVQGVMSAKTLLVLVALPLVVAAMYLVPALHNVRALVGWAFAYAALRGFSPLWFFQGIERQNGAVFTDIVTRVLGALGVFVVVRGPADGIRVLELQAIFAGIGLVVLLVWMRRHVPLRTPDLRAGVRTLRQGSTMFAIRGWSGFYIQANALILSAMTTAPIVAFYGGAERIVRAAINMLQPLTQVFLPRVSYLQSADPRAALRMVRHALLMVGGVGLAMGITAFAGAPLLVHILLGPGYEPAIAVLRFLSLLPILVALTTVLGIYWALPFGHERAFLVSIVAAGVVNVSLAMLLVPRWGAAGMAASAVIAEIVVLVFVGVLFLRYLGREQTP